VDKLPALTAPSTAELDPKSSIYLPELLPDHNMPLKGEYFPNVQFWTRKQWQLFCDSQENLGMHRNDAMHGHQQDQLKPSSTPAYITNTDGIGPDGYQAGEI